jgi:PIN domain nuclease of toxin-antitoxin system
VNVIADTHAVLWWLTADRRLSRRARLVLADAANRRKVSIASLWEIAIKMSSGRLPAAGLTLRDIVNTLSAQQFELRGVETADLYRVQSLPWFHRDPFDRVLIAQAIEDGVPLLTADAAIAQYAVQTTW